jgi:hypothetical protein
MVATIDMIAGQLGGGPSNAGVRPAIAYPTTPHAVAIGNQQYDGRCNDVDATLKGSIPANRH